MNWMNSLSVCDSMSLSLGQLFQVSKPNKAILDVCLYVRTSRKSFPIRMKCGNNNMILGRLS